MQLQRMKTVEEMKEGEYVKDTDELNTLESENYWRERSGNWLFEEGCASCVGWEEEE